MLQRTGIAALPLFTFGMFVLLAWSGVARARADQAQAAAPQPRAPIAAVPRLPEVRWFFAGVMLTVLAHTALYAFFSLYLVGLALRQVVGRLAVGRVGGRGDRVLRARRPALRAHRRTPLVCAAAALVAARFALTAGFGSVPAVLVLAQLTHALTFAAHHMACTSLIARHFPDRLRARGSALYSTLGYGVPAVVGGLAGGALSEDFGLPSVFWASSLAALAISGCCVLAGRAAARASAHNPPP